MKRLFHFVLIVMLATEALVLGQGEDVSKLLAQVRSALGGEETLASVKSLAIEGRLTRSQGERSMTSDFEMALELPDKFVRKEVIAVLGPTSITRTSGFNGESLIDVMDAPPAMGGGHMMFHMSPGGPPPGVEADPDAVAMQRRTLLSVNKKEFARLTLGMFAATQPAFPLEFAYGGAAESPDGKAHVIDVKGPDQFAARLFVDTETHLPLMLSWMDKEPMRMVSTATGGGQGGEVKVQGGGTQIERRNMTPEDAEKFRREMQQHLREAEARRRTVEHRLFYGDYKSFNGVRIPTRIQRMIDGQPTEELSLERVKVNSRIDPKRFEVTK